jgi:tripartite-type tricarboxylate transporter receptor subunit TctC
MVCILVFAAGVAIAAEYPEKTVTFVVPFAAGSATDTLARVAAQEITSETKQRIVVDDKPGASGIIGAQSVAKAAPDGYTVFITTNTTHAANQHLYKKLPYDAVTDFAPVAGLAKGYQIMVVNPHVPAKRVADFIALAKKSPGKLSFGEGSSSARVAVELFQQMNRHAAQSRALQKQSARHHRPTGRAHRHDDRRHADRAAACASRQVTALAVTSKERSPQAPQLPTIDEAGVKGYEMTYWFAAYVPAKTPQPVIRRLNELLVKAIGTESAKAFFAKNGLVPFTTTPDELAKFQAAETQKWGRIITSAGIQPV